jgi:hypothetical protein
VPPSAVSHETIDEEPCGIFLIVPVLGNVKSFESFPDTLMFVVAEVEQGLAEPLSGVLKLTQPVCDIVVVLTPTRTPFM